jgi:hypothetical protein
MSLARPADQDEPIASLTTRSKEKFTRVIRTLEAAGADTGDVTAASLNDAFERLLLWAGNIGAAAASDNKISLEFRLRDAPDIKAQICELLHDLIEALDDRL